MCPAIPEVNFTAASLSMVLWLSSIGVLSKKKYFLLVQLHLSGNIGHQTRGCKRWHSSWSCSCFYHMNNEQKVFDKFVATAPGNSDEKLPSENIIVIMTSAIKPYNAYCVFGEIICLLFGNLQLWQDEASQWGKGIYYKNINVSVGSLCFDVFRYFSMFSAL